MAAAFEDNTRSLATNCVVHSVRTGQLLLELIQQICQSYGLTFSTANTLAIIDGADEPMSASTITNRLLITGGAVTQNLDYLEKRGLIRRLANPNDRRSVLVEATQEGHSLRQKIETNLQQQDEEWMQVLTSGERETLLALLKKIENHLGEKNPQ